MTQLDTIKVNLAPQDAIGLLAQHDQRDESWSLQPESADARKAVFSLWVDGACHSTEITLHADGSWSASTHIVLGEKINVGRQGGN